jgi:hypothetical protein
VLAFSKKTPGTKKKGVSTSFNYQQCHYLRHDPSWELMNLVTPIIYMLLFFVESHHMLLIIYIVFTDDENYKSLAYYKTKLREYFLGLSPSAAYPHFLLSLAKDYHTDLQEICDSIYEKM